MTESAGSSPRRTKSAGSSPRRTKSADASQRRAKFAAAGILFTRVIGLVRQRVFAHYFGTAAEADAFMAALRIPGVVRNLLGEGTLSASFVPVYAGLLEKKDYEGARRLAGNIISILVIAAGLAALAGVLFATWITRFVAIGFDPDTSALTARIVRVLFPMGATMVLSSWCLGILNAHRKFFLSYAAPAVWSIVQIGVLVGLGASMAGADLIMALAFGALGGGILQFVIQLPATVRLIGSLRWSSSLAHSDTRRVISAWVPMVFGAGVLQLSTIIDTQLASLLPGTGDLAVLAYAQMIMFVPISMFGVSVAAVALPEMSRDVATGEGVAYAERFGDGVQRVLFFVLPSAAVFILFGPEVVALVLQTGEFGQQQTVATGLVLTMFGVGLPARAMVRLVTSGHYAFGNTKGPVRVAAVTVLVAAGLSYLLMQKFGVAGIALGGSLAAYLNVGANLFNLGDRISGAMGTVYRKMIGLVVIGVASASVVAILARRGFQILVTSMTDLDPAAGTGFVMVSVSVLVTFGLSYLLVMRLTGHAEARRVLTR